MSDHPFQPNQTWQSEHEWTPEIIAGTTARLADDFGLSAELAERAFHHATHGVSVYPNDPYAEQELAFWGEHFREISERDARGWRLHELYSVTEAEGNWLETECFPGMTSAAIGDVLSEREASWTLQKEDAANQRRYREGYLAAIGELIASEAAWSSIDKEPDDGQCPSTFGDLRGDAGDKRSHHDHESYLAALAGQCYATELKDYWFNHGRCEFFNSIARHYPDEGGIEIEILRRIQASATTWADSGGDEEFTGIGKMFEAKPGLRLWNALDLIRSHPAKREPVVDGLLRRGEVCNVIAPPKTGKSWLVINGVLQIATGGDWLGHNCEQGRVLVLDNELHQEELADRYRRVADAMGVGDEVLRDRVTLLPLRGVGLNIHDVQTMVEKHAESLGGYSVIVLDALYRFLPPKVSENDNAGMMSVYNTLDAIAKTLDAAVIVIHHTSKGDQSSKGVTDVGAGAGSISRAADTHLTIRQHELEDSYVVEAVTRSWIQPQPKTCVFNFPIWRATEIEPALKQIGQRREDKQRQDDADADMLLATALTKNQWLSEAQIVRATGMGPGRVSRVVGRAIAGESIVAKRVKKSGRRTTIYASSATASATAKR